MSLRKRTMALRIIFVFILLLSHVGSAQLKRAKRQVIINNQLPSSTNQEVTAQCVALSGPPPIGCNYLPLVTDSSGGPRSCRLDCPDGSNSLQLQPVSSELGPLIFPELPNDFFSSMNEVNTVDFSNINTYSGNSFAVLPTTPSPFLTTASLSNVIIGKSRLASSSSSLIEACINAGLIPNTGCSFNGNGSPAPTLTCSQTCASPSSCNPRTGSIIDRCLCVNGAPPSGCSYTLGGSLDPLTCPSVCRPLLPASTGPAFPSDGLIEACIAGGFVPPAGCSFSGSGSFGPPSLSCGVVCAPPPPPISPACNPISGTHIEQCLCKRGSPNTGCSYKLAGSSDPLTCVQICRPLVPTGPTFPSDALIEACIAAGVAPSPGCSFSGYGTFPPPQPTCAQICTPAPFPIGPACDANSGTHIQQCLCTQGPPNRGCSYKLAGSFSPLTCIQICIVFPVFTTPSTVVTTMSPDAIIEACIQSRPPPRGCSYTGQGVSSPLTCPSACVPFCPSGPGASCGCGSETGLHVQRCLCAYGAPAYGCSYRATGSSSPLTCSQVCTPNFLPVTTTTTAPVPSTAIADANIQQCMAANGPPPAGCSYSDNMGAEGTATCAVVCLPAPPPIAPACNPSAGSHIQQCLCANGSPSHGCTYLASGTSTPLSCPQVCAPLPGLEATTTPPTTTSTISSTDSEIGNCFAAGIIPSAGCSFSGEGFPGSCAQVCPQDPFISGPCDPNSGSHIEQCMCVNGSPPIDCTYKSTGSSNPLTCSRMCKIPSFPS